MTTTVERKYALSRVKAGDYLLPSNDGRRIYRIARYTDGPSSGLDWPRDRELWGIWKWHQSIDRGGYVDSGDWDLWEFQEGFHETRQAAVDAALGLS